MIRLKQLDRLQQLFHLYYRIDDAIFDLHSLGRSTEEEYLKRQHTLLNRQDRLNVMCDIMSEEISDILLTDDYASVLVMSGPAALSHYDDVIGGWLPLRKEVFELMDKGISNY